MQPSTVTRSSSSCSDSLIEASKDFVVKLIVDEGGDATIRRIRLFRILDNDGKISFDKLVRLVGAKTKRHRNATSLKLSYLDIDEDFIVVESAEDLVDAIDQFSDQRVIRLFVGEVTPNTREAFINAGGCSPMQREDRDSFNNGVSNMGRRAPSPTQQRPSPQHNQQSSTGKNNNNNNNNSIRDLESIIDKKMESIIEKRIEEILQRRFRALENRRSQNTRTPTTDLIDNNLYNRYPSPNRAPPPNLNTPKSPPPHNPSSSNRHWLGRASPTPEVIVPAATYELPDTSMSARMTVREQDLLESRARATSNWSKGGLGSPRGSSNSSSNNYYNINNNRAGSPIATAIQHPSLVSPNRRETLSRDVIGGVASVEIDLSVSHLHDQEYDSLHSANVAAHVGTSSFQSGRSNANRSMGSSHANSYSTLKTAKHTNIHHHSNDNTSPMLSETESMTASSSNSNHSKMDSYRSTSPVPSSPANDNNPTTTTRSKSPFPSMLKQYDEDIRDTVEDEESSNEPLAGQGFVESVTSTSQPLGRNDDGNTYRPQQQREEDPPPQVTEWDNTSVDSDAELSMLLSDTEFHEEEYMAMKTTNNNSQHNQTTNAQPQQPDRRDDVNQRGPNRSASTAKGMKTAGNITPRAAAATTFATMKRQHPPPREEPRPRTPSNNNNAKPSLSNIPKHIPKPVHTSGRKNRLIGILYD